MPAPSDFIGSIQSCLQQVVGAWVPQTGFMGPGTRRAIRIFQTRNGIPVTGLLDEGTVSAINAGCGVTPPPAQGGPPPDAAGPGAEGPPEGGAAPAEGGSEEPAGEMESEMGGGQQQELQVTAPCEVNIRFHKALEITTEQQMTQLPAAPGVYIIYSRNKPWYVGLAEDSIQKRFQHRFKALKDFDIPVTALAKRPVACLSIDVSTLKACAIGRRAKRSGKPYTTVAAKTAVLKVLEQFLIKFCKTKGLGNVDTEDVHFTGSGSLEIKGLKTPVKLDAKNPI